MLTEQRSSPVGERAWLTLAGALGCYLEMQGVKRELLVKGYAVYPDVFARIFLGTSNLAFEKDLRP